MSNLSSCSSDSCPHRTCSTMLLAWKGIEKKDRSHASWQNKECFLVLFIHSRKMAFFGNALNPAVPCSKRCVDFLLWQIQDKLEKQCEKKCFCQAVVPGFISESENSRKRKPSFFSYCFVAKEKKNQRVKWKTVVKSQQNSLYRREDAEAQAQSCKTSRRWLWPGMDP